MDVPNTFIVAIVTTNQDKVKAGGSPIFIVDHQDKLEMISNSLSKIMDASTHQIEPDTMIIVKH